MTKNCIKAILEIKRRYLPLYFIVFKVALMVYKVVDRQALQYLELLTRIADSPSRRALRSADTSHLYVPSV